VGKGMEAVRSARALRALPNRNALLRSESKPLCSSCAAEHGSKRTARAEAVKRQEV
jgi:hypothetical protein